MPEDRFISESCEGEFCSMCGKPATNKVGEEIMHDDPLPNRHNLTAYVCDYHFKCIFQGPTLDPELEGYCKKCQSLTGPLHDSGCDRDSDPDCRWYIKNK